MKHYYSTYLLLVCSLLVAGRQETLAQQPELEVEKMPEGVNTAEYDEISPVVSRDGRELYFVRTGAPDFNRNLTFNGTDAADSLNEGDYLDLLGEVYAQLGSALGAEEEAWTSGYNQDVWVAELDEAGTFLRVQHPDTPLNNALPNSLAAALPEPGHFVVMNQFPEAGGMRPGFSHAYRRADDSWSWPQPIEIDGYYNQSSDVGLTLSSDAEVMILSLERDGGYGSNDLYISKRIDSTHWSTPVNLGGEINTTNRETTPSLSEDKRTLYFSSDRWGHGGSDIYFSRRLDDTWKNWGAVRRFKDPITSDSDDSKPYFNEATGYLYFSSKRDGSSDIFRVRVQKPKPLDIRIVGSVRHARTGEPLDAEVVIHPVNSNNLDTSVQTTDGRFEYRLTSLHDLVVSADREGYIGHVEHLSLRSQSYLDDYRVEILLDPQEKGGTITLDPIFFEQSLAEIKEESEPELVRLRDVLEKYPNIYVRIEGHTDNQGPQKALDKLSRERAEAIRAYLVDNGIEGQRVQAAGIGARKPVADNSTQQGRERNRRVEVVITRILSAGKGESR